MTVSSLKSLFLLDICKCLVKWSGNFWLIFWINFFAFLLVLGISIQNLPCSFFLLSPLFLSFTASVFVSIYNCHPHIHPYLSLSVLLLPYVISFFLILILLLLTLSHSHLSHLHVVTLHSIFTFVAISPFRWTSSYWRLFSLSFTTICPLFPFVHCPPLLLISSH